MKMKLLQKKGSSLAAMFTAVVIACFGLAQQGEAVVMWEVSEVGGDVTIVASGTLDLPGGGSVSYPPHTVLRGSPRGV